MRNKLYNNLIEYIKNNSETSTMRNEAGYLIIKKVIELEKILEYINQQNKELGEKMGGKNE